MPLPEIEELLTAFRRITSGMLMLNDRPPRSVDEALAIGERLSSRDALKLWYPERLAGDPRVRAVLRRYAERTA